MPDELPPLVVPGSPELLEPSLVVGDDESVSGGGGGGPVTSPWSMHSPPTQAWPSSQLLPQSPQLLGSLSMSTQSGPHAVPGPPSQGSVSTHWAAMHSSCSLHTLPHAPQLFSSLPRKTHSLPHGEPPPGHRH